MKKVQGQGKVREFLVEYGKFGRKSGKSQGILYQLVIFLNFVEYCLIVQLLDKI